MLIGGNRGGPGGGGSTSLASWVAANGKVVSLGGSQNLGTLYDFAGK